jgi:hypothetical protein
MRAGERAAVYITDPAYGYGDKGSFSFPSVPPSCQLVYEVDMIAWEPPAEVRAAVDVHDAERSGQLGDVAVASWCMRWT